MQVPLTSLADRLRNNAMPTPRNPTRQRLIDAALALLTQQGITETTTKQIAELAEVNEVTLFRQFGNKQGLVLAVLEESEMFTRLALMLGQNIDRSCAPDHIVRTYVQSFLRLLDAAPELLRSIVGESSKSPIETKEALGRGIQQVNQQLATELGGGMGGLSDRSVRILNSTLLGYAMLNLTTELQGLWLSREEFIEAVVLLMVGQPSTEGIRSAITNSATVIDFAVIDRPVIDLPASLVQTLFQRAQKKGAMEMAIVYLLFGAGIRPVELTILQRVHHLSDRDVQVLQITQGAIRQVPINQWIMGKRYGTHLKNPLTQWLKTRKDTQSALFIDADQKTLTIAQIQTIWQDLTMDLLNLNGTPLTIEQAQQTWCIEMLLRGITLDDMQILAGLSIEQLAPYGVRAKEKTVLEKGLALDKAK